MPENDGVKRYMDYLRQAMLAIGRLAITEELLETNLRNVRFYYPFLKFNLPVV